MSNCDERQKIISLRMERQRFVKKANEEEYRELFRDASPGYQIYWIGFGQPPVLTYRAEFDDAEYNRARMKARSIVLGRFIGGNIGWVEKDDMALYGSLYKKPLPKNAAEARYLLDVLSTTGPLGVQQLKEETGLLVKTITPALKQLQQAFLIFEDRYDNEWDRCFYPFGEFFPDADLNMNRLAALETVIKRFAYRNIVVDKTQLKSFFGLPASDIDGALQSLKEKGEIAPSPTDDGYMLTTDKELLKSYSLRPLRFTYAINRNDFLYRSFAHVIKPQFAPLYENLPYDHEPFHYLLIDGEFHGVSVGHVHNGPFDINDIVTDLPQDLAKKYRDEIIAAVTNININTPPIRFMSEELISNN